MTTQESFKRRVRDRMAKTGERYNAARRVLLERAAANATAAGGAAERVWVADPMHTDEAIRAATGRGWNEWCDLIEAWPGHVDGHAAIALHVHDVHGLTHWWAQGVTVSYERITGQRLAGQMADGTFTANKSKTVPINAAELRAMLLDDADRTDLFGGLPTTLRSKPSTKVLRVEIGPGVATFTIEPTADGRTKVAIGHEKLPSAASIDEWKHFWNEWLDALGDWSPRPTVTTFTSH